MQWMDILRATICPPRTEAGFPGDALPLCLTPGRRLRTNDPASAWLAVRSPTVGSPRSVMQGGNP